MISEVIFGNFTAPSILISAMMNEPVLKDLKIWRLATSDAHFLYEKFGFKALAHPEKLMEKIMI